MNKQTLTAFKSLTINTQVKIKAEMRGYAEQKKTGDQRKIRSFNSMFRYCENTFGALDYLHLLIEKHSK